MEMNKELKTIKIQNCSGFEDYWFNIIVNGKEYAMNNHFITIHLPDDNSYEIKVEYSMDGHPTTASSFIHFFYPKDNVVLQISKVKLTKTLLSLTIGMILTTLIAVFYKNGRFFIWIPILPPLFIGIYQMVRKKKLLFIQEVPMSKNGV